MTFKRRFVVKNHLHLSLILAELDRLQNQTGRQLPPDLTVLFDSLVRLLEQIENMPWMKADDAKIQELGRTLTRTE